MEEEKDQFSKKEIQKLNKSIPKGVKGSFVKDSDEFQANLEIQKAKFQRKAADMMYSFGGVPETSRVPLLYVDPMFDPILLMFPKENIKELNRRLRHYYTYHPIVRNCIDLHSTSPDTTVICNPGTKTISEISSGDKVLCADGKFHKVLWQQKHPFEGEMFTIKPYYYPEFKVTYNHPVLVYTPDTQTCNWVLTHTLTKNDYLVVPKLKAEVSLPVIDLAEHIDLKSTFTTTQKEHLQTGKHHSDKRLYKSTKTYKDNINRCYTITKDSIIIQQSKRTLPRYITITPALCELLGWYISKGSGWQSVCYFSLNQNEIKHSQRIKQLLEQVFFVDVKLHSIKSGKSVYVYFINILYKNLFQNLCGKKVINKHVPEFLFYAPKEYVKAFLRGYFQGDGCFKAKDNSFSFTTISKQLAYQVLLLSTKLDILFNIHYTKPEYVCTARRTTILTRVFDHISLVESPVSYLEDKNNFYVPIQNISTSFYKGDVYDIKTDQHNFCLPCVIHNSEFPLSDFELRCSDKGIEQYYNDLKEKINLLKIMVELNRDYWLLGEGFEYGNWDENNFEWISFNQYPPENIDVYRTYVGPGVVYYLKADEELKRIINSPREVDRAIANLVPEEFREHVRAGKPYLLANERVIHFARRPSGYSLRGESLVKSVLKDLLYEDKVRLLQYTFVDRHTYPIKIWRIGSKDKGWIPSPKHFKAFEAQLIQACFSADTELLTEDGFKKLSEIDVTDCSLKIATFNPEAETIEYYNPTKWNVYDYKGEMIHFKTPDIDCLVTPNHKMWTKLCDEDHKDNSLNNWDTIEAKDITVGYQFRSVESCDDSGKNFSVKKGFYPKLTEQSQIQKVNYEGKVFCPTVPPHHLVVARRDGKVVITGQSNDPDYNIITHPYVEAEFLTAVGKTADLDKQFDFVQKRLMIGLFASDAMLHGESLPYASQAVSMKVVMHRYLTNRTLLENLIREKVFLPVAVARGFIERTQAELDHKVRITGNKYVLPKFFYTQRLNLLSSTAEQEMLIRLRDKGEIPLEIIADVFGWDIENLKKAFQREHSTELDPLWRKAREEIIKDPKVRNQVLDGVKTEDLKIFEDTAVPTKKGPGRPALPEEEKIKPEPAIIPPGPGVSSPRLKQEEREVIPKPMGETEKKETPTLPT